MVKRPWPRLPVAPLAERPLWAKGAGGWLPLREALCARRQTRSLAWWKPWCAVASHRTRGAPVAQDPFGPGRFVPARAEELLAPSPVAQGPDGASPVGPAPFVLALFVPAGGALPFARLRGRPRPTLFAGVQKCCLRVGRALRARRAWF